jgi:hypothetical protein
VKEKNQYIGNKPTATKQSINQQNNSAAAMSELESTHDLSQCHM